MTVKHMGADFWVVVQWWAALFLVGAIAFPLTKRLFSEWHDGGYLFSKAAGMATVTWLVYVLGTLRVLPFTVPTIAIALGVVFVGGILLNRSHKIHKRYKTYVILLGEELFFFLALLFWSWIKAHEPAIHDLEKFMDFGFTKSLLSSAYFPAPDMWYAGSPINYYHFGHLVMAVLTKLSGLDLAYTFNLMLASLFALTLTMSFSIGLEIGIIREIGKRRKIFLGILAAFLVTMAGNLQTIYAFTNGYIGDNVKPFWEIGWSLRGFANYWYANATRFIPFTIHEFPSYSFVVSDVHGHVLSLPFVLLAIAMLIGLKGERWKIGGGLIFYGFLVGVLLMTNALDGPIYLGLFAITLVIFNFQFSIFNRKKIIIPLAMVVVIAGLTSLPFLLHFKSFVSGIGVNCPPAFLANTKIGPFLFEGVEKCQKSPLWMMAVLWGLFLYCGTWLIARIFNFQFSIFNQTKKFSMATKITQIEKILLIFFIFSIGLLIFPEFFYFKDIYPAHFRSNTMFKLGYQAFIMLSIVSAYTIVTIKKKIFFLFLIPLLFLVSIYPYFSVRSYFGELKTYKGLYGLTWFANQYPDDYAAIQWLNKSRIPSKRLGTGMNHGAPVIVEADGDSYTDYARFSTLTGMPTVIGWAVHEWLWRGTYDVVSPRREDVRLIYESINENQTRQLLDRYGVQYVVIGTLERTKYAKLSEEKFRNLGTEVFRSGNTVIYRMASPFEAQDRP